MCGRLNRSGPITSKAVRGSGGASVIIEGSVFASHAAAGKLCSRSTLSDECCLQPSVLGQGTGDARADSLIANDGCLIVAFVLSSVPVQTSCLKRSRRFLFSETIGIRMPLVLVSIKLAESLGRRRVTRWCPCQRASTWTAHTSASQINVACGRVLYFASRLLGTSQTPSYLPSQVSERYADTEWYCASTCVSTIISLMLACCALRCSASSSF